MHLKHFVPKQAQPFARRLYHRLLAEYDRYMYERPSKAYRQSILSRATLPDFSHFAESLCDNGAVVIPNYFDQTRLKEMQLEFERLVRTNPSNDCAESQASVHIATKRFTETKLFSELAFEPNMLRLVQYYWGKPVVLNGTGGTRYEPAELGDSGSNQWHHDGKRKQVRVFIFLTDVPEEGQCTKYIPGSHKTYHYDISNSRLDHATFLPDKEIGCCAGPAGSIAILDTNCAHRANRNAGSRRDIWNFSFRAAGSLSTKLNPVPILHPDVSKHLTNFQREIARLA